MPPQRDADAISMPWPPPTCQTGAMRPMLATPSAQPGVPPSGPDWVHEVKWDGIRLLADRSEAGLRLFNRNEIDVTMVYPELTAPGAGLPDDVLLDGEVVVLDAAGRPTLQSIASRMHVRDARRIRELVAARPATFMVFDVLRLDGKDTTGLPLEARRELLDSLDLPALGPAWQTPPQEADGAALAQATRAAELEGVVSKRLGSRYQPGRRSPDWVKVPHRDELVGVIGGWVPETEHADRLGSVWVGHPADEAGFASTGMLYPLARVGSGLSHAERAQLLTVLRETEINFCPFDPVPEGPEARRSRWVWPAICVQVRYLGTSESGVLRQPVLRRLRPELGALDAATAELVDPDS